MRIALSCFGLLALAACATATGTSYVPADKQGYGYSETRIENDRYRITFAGDGATSEQDVEDFALLRAADLALADGYDWFRVVSRATDSVRKGGVGVGAGLGTGSVGRNTSVGVGVSGDFGRIGDRPFFTTRLEVLLGKGVLPAEPDVFDARAVRDRVGTRLAAPAE